MSLASFLNRMSRPMCIRLAHPSYEQKQWAKIVTVPRYELLSKSCCFSVLIGLRRTGFKDICSMLRHYLCCAQIH